MIENKKDDKKKNIRTLNWYQRFWYPRQSKEAKKAKSDKS